jgi:acyl-CoA thioesterase-1
MLVQCKKWYAGLCAGLVLLGSFLVLSSAQAKPIIIVAIGASNTTGWGVPASKNYPAQLQTLLRARGYQADVQNAGVNFDTTNGMLARIDGAVPDNASLVIIQPGGNDLRFFGTRERRAANIAAMVAKMRARGIKTIVYDPVFDRKYYQWDTIHINVEGHAFIAHSLLPQVIAAIGSRTR